ncbi:helix-turn-helix transcriptional regulator [Enterobacter roggenkampii]|uniref:helix-turn-helix transcriptional regulator n=1 Tax=Enterobacter roggenkampii TaxID=1812935 RepID=UPI00389AE0F6
MNISICSSDTFYTLGWNDLISSLPLTHVDCTSRVLFVDLYCPGDLRKTNLKNVCYVIYLSNFASTFESLCAKYFGFEVYYLKRNLTLDSYYTYLSNLLLMIMQKKCHWKGINPITNNTSKPNLLTSREQQIILLALSSINNTGIASALKIHTKTVSSHKVKAASKLGIYDRVHFAEIARQISKISELQNLHERTIGNFRPSSANICRSISYLN